VLTGQPGGVSRTGGQVGREGSQPIFRLLSGVRGHSLPVFPPPEQGFTMKTTFFGDKTTPFVEAADVRL